MPVIEVYMAHLPQKVQEELQLVRQIVDKLGMPIDKDIELPVAALRCLGFTTTASCGGHIERRSAGPYIDIVSSKEAHLLKILQAGPDYGEEYLENARAIEKVNIKESARLLRLVQKFYNSRPSTFRSMLEVAKGGYLSARLQGQAAFFMASKEFDEPAYIAHVRDVQAEMRAFGEFLCSKIG